MSSDLILVRHGSKMPSHSSHLSSTSRRVHLARCIERNGITMPTPCAYCKSHRLECKVDLRSGRCAECVRRARKCDLVVTRAEFDKLRSSRLKLKEQLERAEDEEEKLSEEHEVLLARIRTQQARIRRLRKQLRFSEHQEGAAFEKELASIEEAEEQERSLLASSSEPLAVELPPLEVFPIDDRLMMSPSQWADLAGDAWSFDLGGTSVGAASSS